MVEELKLGGLYQHYKGKNYIVHNVVKHSETLEWFVMYECLYDNLEAKFWVRPLKMFQEIILVNGKHVPRFRYISDQKRSVKL